MCSADTTPPFVLLDNAEQSSPWGDLPTAFGSSRKRPSSAHRYKDRAQQTCVDFNVKVNQLFDKKFHFKPESDEWELPQPQDMFAAVKWKDKPLQKLKAQLNAVKNKLNDYDLDEWHRHTRRMNKAGEIASTLRNEFHPEFLTQAWCKFYENVTSFPLVPDIPVGERFCSLHLCEAPGAFITALNHYLKINRPNVTWDWLATTLNPYHEGNPLSDMINDDRFIMQTLDHWCFGQDNTGNLMCVGNLMYLINKAKARGKFLLVTADGSIDCQQNPDEQEAVVSRLHYCETVTALHILAPGGSFLLKSFTLFECDTICLLYLLCCAFKSVSVNKPVTSKEGNSEVYIVCLEYRGLDFMEPWLHVLRQNYGSETRRNAMFQSLSLPNDFLDQLEECAEKFANYQIEVIENNIWTFRHKNDIWMTKRLRNLVTQRFVQIYNIQRLLQEDEIVGRLILKHMNTYNIEPRSEVGSFNERQNIMMLPQLQMLAALKTELEVLDIQWPFKHDIKWLKFLNERIEPSIQTGLPVTTVRSSKFCLGKLLRIRNRVKQLVTGDSICQPNDTVKATMPRNHAKQWEEQTNNTKQGEEQSNHTKQWEEQSNQTKQWEEQTNHTKQWEEQTNHTKQWEEQTNHTKQWEEQTNHTKQWEEQTNLPNQWEEQSNASSNTLEESVKEESPSEFVLSLKRQFPGAVVLDFKALLWTSLDDGRNGTAESSAFLQIKNTLNELWRDNTLIVVGYPMLTQFNVGVIYVMGHLFEKMGFVRPTGQDFAVVFNEFRHWDKAMLKFLDQVNGFIDTCALIGSTAVLAILPITVLCGSSQVEADSLVAEESNTTVGSGPQDFYSCVLEVNNICVEQQTSELIDTVLNTSQSLDYHSTP